MPPDLEPQIESSNGTPVGVGTGNGAGSLLAANNLSDVASVSAARTSLGLGTAALLPSTAFDAAGAAAAVASTLGTAATHNASEFDAAGAAAAVSTTSIGAVPTSRTLQGTSPIAIAGDYSAHDLSGNRVITFAIASQAQGDLLYCNGSAWTRLGIGARGTFLNANDGLTHTYVALSLMPRIDVATTTALPAYTASNSAGTLTANANGAFPTIDGVSATTSNVYLVMQNSVTDNIHVGVYKLTTLGDGSNPWVLTRHDRLWVGASASGTRALVRNGTTQTGYEYQCQTTPGSDVVGTNTITFSLIGSPISSTAAANLGAAASAGAATTTSAQDHVHLFPGSGMFGTGADGAVSITSGTTTLTRDMYYSSLSVSAGATLNTAGYRVFCTGTITNNGTVGRPGNAASAATQGATLAAQALGQGTAGGAGGTTGAGTSGTATGQAMGGAGGTGGTGGGGAGASGGGATAVPANQGPTDGFLGYLGLLANPNARFLDYQNGGSGGGGGGGSAGGSGGGGGGGGGVACIVARSLAGAGVYTVAGGAGGNANGAGDGGGGAGGGGGRLIIAYVSTSGAWTSTAAGGGAGNKAGSGTNGNAGANGTVLTIQLAA